MRSVAGLSFSLILTGLLVLAMSREANAYIDPASTSLILNALIAVAVGAGFAVKIFWKQIKAFFSTAFSRKHKVDPPK